MLTGEDGLSTRQYFPLNVGERGTPVFVVVGMEAGICRSAGDLASPRCLDIAFHVIQARKQLRRQLRAVVVRQGQGIVENPLRLRRHEVIVDRRGVAFNRAAGGIPIRVAQIRAAVR